MGHHILWVAAALSLSGTCAHGALITTLDFTDGNWSTTLSATTGPTNDSSATATTITADKSGSMGGVRIEVTLTGSLSTVGFENITLGFTGQATGLEWNAALTSPVSNADGLRVVGSGVAIDANQLNDLTGTAAEAEFNAGTVFPTADFQTGFSFDSSVNNSAISMLQFQLQVNANAESLSLSNAQIFGDPVAAVPEPNCGLLLITAFGAVIWRRRRTRKPGEPDTAID